MDDLIIEGIIVGVVELLFLIFMVYKIIKEAKQ
jgi:hypothetical protein